MVSELSGEGYRCTAHAEGFPSQTGGDLGDGITCIAIGFSGSRICLNLEEGTTMGEGPRGHCRNA